MSVDNHNNRKLLLLELCNFVSIILICISSFILVYNKLLYDDLIKYNLIDGLIVNSSMLGIWQTKPDSLILQIFIGEKDEILILILVASLIGFTLSKLFTIKVSKYSSYQ